MATKIIKTVIQFRRDTAANWLTNKDVIPAAGEPCFITDENILKIGDGVTTFENLTPISGVSVSADDKSVIIEDGTFKLFGFDAAATGAQPRKNADGTIDWIVPSADTVDGLQTAVASLQSDVSDLQALVGTAEEGADPLITRVSALEGEVDTLNGDANTEGSVLKIVKDEINAFATNVTDDGVVNSYKELIDYVATHGSEAAKMASDITSLQESISNKVDKVDGKSLIADTLIAKLESIEADAQVNKIESISVGGTLLEIAEKSINIPVATNTTFGVVKGSDEVGIATDGTLEIGAISIEKITQEDSVVIVMDGGASA